MDAVRVPVLTGPTASGKSAVALAFAALAPTEIIAADSRTAYRGLDIGTAKPSRQERAAVPHHGLDVVEPTERYSAGRFARDAAAWIEDVTARQRLPLVVGGTGFYLRALFEGLFDQPDLDEATRDALQHALRGRSSGELQRWARRLDPGFRGSGGRQRASRVIEVTLLTGTPLSRLQAAAPASPSGVQPFYARIELPRALLEQRIRARVRAMLEQGLVDEVRGLLQRGVPRDAPGLTGVGYREVVEMLAGHLPEADLAEDITVGTRRYAKRQETWFRHQLAGPVLVLDGTRPAPALAQDLLSGYRAAR